MELTRVYTVARTRVITDEGMSLFDTIEHEGRKWLVPLWIDGTPAPGCSRPVRIVGIRYAVPDTAWSNLWLNSPLPTALFEGHVPPQLQMQYCVTESPAVYVDNRSAAH